MNDQFMALRLQGGLNQSRPMPDCWRPSEYTALLIQGLRLAGGIDGAEVLEVGVGSGVVLAAMAAMGARRLSGVDIEAGAVARAAALVPQADLRQGDMWTPFRGQRFDVIAANLPHFPSEEMHVAGRLASWSVGGADGRRLLDELLDGLSGQLAVGGRAVVTHNAFVDLERSRACLRRHGLRLRALLTSLVHIPGDKLADMTPAVRSRFSGGALQHYGGQAFGEVHVVEIAHTDWQ